MIWLQLYVILKSGDELIDSALIQIREEREQVISELSAFDQDSYFDSEGASEGTASHMSRTAANVPGTVIAGGVVAGGAAVAAGRKQKKTDGDESSDSEYDSEEESEYSDSGSEYSGSGSETSAATMTKAKIGAGAAQTAGGARKILDMPSTDDNGNVVTIHGPPLPPPNFTYSLKIALGFLQIVSNVASGLEIQWPSRYEEFVLYFDVANFDFIVQSSFSCVDSLSYYRTFLVIVLTPIVVFVVIGVFYLLPRYYGLCGRTSEETQFRSNINFWRMFLYILFLIYPGVSSTVLRLYICKNVFGKHYLLTDVRVECYTETWTYFAYSSISLVILYPIGIPLFFYSLLRINRDELQEDRVKAQIGFLYGGYRNDVWWFEIADSIHKLFLTSVLAFFPRDSQLPVGMSAAIVYLMILLRINPYIRKTNDGLHMMAQIEIFLLLMAGNVIYNQDTDELAAKEDLYISLVLIFITCLFIFLFVWQGGIFLTRVLKRWYKEWKEERSQKQAKVHPEGADSIASDAEAGRMGKKSVSSLSASSLSASSMLSGSSLSSSSASSASSQSDASSDAGSSMRSQSRSSIQMVPIGPGSGAQARASKPLPPLTQLAESLAVTPPPQPKVVQPPPKKPAALPTLPPLSPRGGGAGPGSPALPPLTPPSPSSAKRPLPPLPPPSPK